MAGEQTGGKYKQWVVEQFCEPVALLRLGAANANLHLKMLVWLPGCRDVVVCRF